jgi:hypothetical protein
MVGGEMPGWMAARDDGTVAVSSDLEVVRQTLCADIDEDRFAKEVYPALRAGVPVECGHSQYRPADGELGANDVPDHHAGGHPAGAGVRYCPRRPIRAVLSVG